METKFLLKQALTTLSLLLALDGLQQKRHGNVAPLTGPQPSVMLGQRIMFYHFSLSAMLTVNQLNILYLVEIMQLCAMLQSKTKPNKKTLSSALKRKTRLIP